MKRTKIFSGLDGPAQTAEAGDRQRTLHCLHATGIVSCVASCSHIEIAFLKKLLQFPSYPSILSEKKTQFFTAIQVFGLKNRVHRMARIYG